MPEYTKEYRIAQLLAKQMTGSLTPEEEHELQEWENNPSNKSLRIKIEDPENKRRRTSLIHELDTNSSWQKVEKRISRKSKARIHKLAWWSSTAAAIILLALALLPNISSKKEMKNAIPVAKVQPGSFKATFITPEGKQFNLSLQDTTRILELGSGIRVIAKKQGIEYIGDDKAINYKGKKNTVRVPRGGEYELILPDGTHVWINSDSELSFPVQFSNDKREVLLSGEAYFDVAKMQDCPFIVKTNNLDIQVLGTQFNVQAYPDAKVTETTLCEGSVKVSDGENSVTLHPSQQAVYVKADKNLSTRKVNTRSYTTWRKGMFVFENESLENIMNTLSRWYDIHVFYESPVVKNYHFTGDLERYSNFQKALNMIEKATSIQFVINGNTVIVKQ